MQNNKPIQKAFGHALNLISYRQRAEAELRNKLSDKFAPDVVDATIQLLKEQGLIDDAKFAAEWADSRTRQSPRSSRMIMRELVNKGVSPSLAESSVEDMDDEATAFAAAAKFAARLTDNDRERFHRKLWGHLQRRGYSAGVSRRVISQLWQKRHTSADW